VFSFQTTVHGSRKVTQELQSERLERAIGVIYRPETERWSHYFQASLSAQFDAVIHFDETRAVEPLERTSVWEKGELPDRALARRDCACRSNQSCSEANFVA
jgi:Erythromycin esterase